MNCLRLCALCVTSRASAVPGGGVGKTHPLHLPGSSVRHGSFPGFACEDELFPERHGEGPAGSGAPRSRAGPTPGLARRRPEPPGLPVPAVRRLRRDIPTFWAPRAAAPIPGAETGLGLASGLRRVGSSRTCLSLCPRQPWELGPQNEAHVCSHKSSGASWGRSQGPRDAGKLPGLVGKRWGAPQGLPWSRAEGGPCPLWRPAPGLSPDPRAPSPTPAVFLWPPREEGEPGRNPQAPSRPCPSPAWADLTPTPLCSSSSSTSCSS